MQLVEVPRRVRHQGTSRRGEARLDFEVRAAARRQRTLRGDAAAGDEERARVPRVRPRRDDAALDRAQPREPFELPADMLERPEPVAEPRRIFVPPRIGELRESPAYTRQREGRPFELLGAERARRELRAPARANRPERRRLRRGDDCVATLA